MTQTQECGISNGATAQLARFVHETTAQDVPAPARHAGRRALVNIVGCCVGGARHDIVETALRALAPLSGAATTGVLGRRDRTDMLSATLLNGLSSAAYSFDDTHAQAILHPSGAAASALLALAGSRPLSGADFLLAFVLGVDIALRVSKAISVAPAEGDIGWSQTGVAAGIGAAAAAAARSLSLDAQGITRAIGIAALQASGWREAHGTMAASLIFGHAAQCGLRAALLAQQGMSAPLEPLEGRYGLLSLFARRAHADYLSDCLGDRLEVEALAFKPYPCGVVIHPALDAALAWCTRHPGRSGDIEGVQLRVHPSAASLGFRRHPSSELEAKVSLFHWVAAALARGRASLAEGKQAVIDDPAVRRLREAIELQPDETLAPDAAVMTVSTAGGAGDCFAVEHAKGSVTNPMSDEDLSAKFRGQVQAPLGDEVTERLLRSCWTVDELPHVDAIVQQARAK